MKCPLCKWDLTPTKSVRLNCWVVLCLHWTCYAIKQNDATKGWKKLYRKFCDEHQTVVQKDDVRKD